jgi:hypothetical protein
MTDYTGALEGTLDTLEITAQTALERAQLAIERLDALPSTPLPTPVGEVTQEELDKLEADLQAWIAQDKADDAAAKTLDDKQTADISALASRVGSGQAVGANPDNAIYLDSMPGSGDDAKLTQALDVARVSSPRRPIRLSARNHSFNLTRETFDGLRVLGPNVGWTNPEIAGSGGALPQCNITINCGTGPNSWMVGKKTTYDVTFVGFCVKSSNGASQFYDHPYSAGTSYATHMADLAFYGLKHVLGRPADAFAMTLNSWGGIWTCVAVQDTQFSLRGSDNFLTPQAMNYGWAGANGGRYLMRFAHLAKTQVANLYLTCRGGSRALLIEGGANHQGGLNFSGCIIEGQNLNDPAMGALIVVKGGGTTFSKCSVNFAMARPADFADQKDTAPIMVLGGVVSFSEISTCKATAATTNIPFIDVQGGVAMVDKVLAMQGDGGYTTGQQLTYKVAAAGKINADASLAKAA